MPTMQYMPDLEEGQVLKFSIEPAEAGAKVVSVPRAVANGDVTVRASAAVGTTLAALGDNGSYTTNGWDTVYAVALPDVNSAIVKQKSSPTSWSAHIPAGGFTPKIDATGAFTDWQLTTGGSGSIVRMHVPFSADVTVGDTTNYDVQGGVAYVEVKLKYIPQPPVADTTPNDLKVRDSGGSPDDPVVTVSSVTYTSPSPAVDGLAGALLNLLEQWMNANLQDFQHVFATVDIATEEATGDFAWLAPTSTSYAYLDNDDINYALLGILSMTENRSPEEAVQSIGADAIPTNARASFNLSLERVMSKMILPALPLEFTHAPAGTFTLSGDATQIVAGQSFDLDQVKVGAINYTPNVTNFSIAFVNGELQTSIQVHTPISPGIDAYFSGTYYTTMSLATKSDGTQSLTWNQAQNPVTNSWYTVANWITITEAIVSLILAVAGAVVGGVATSVTNTVVKVLIAVLVGGVVGAIVFVLTQIPNWIAGSVPEQAPSVSGLTDGATKPQKWADSTEFQITTAVLNGGMQLGGSPFGS
jgi:Clostridium P-47 protein